MYYWDGEKGELRTLAIPDTKQRPEGVKSRTSRELTVLGMACILGCLEVTRPLGGEVTG